VGEWDGAVVVIPGQTPCSRDRSTKGRRLLFATILSLAALVLLAGDAWAAENVTVTHYEVQETLTMTVNELGDAHYTDVLKYDAAFFKTASIDLDRYPMLLSRRYERQAAVSEIQNFKATLDRENATVTLTFDKPGFAYNMGDSWMVPFFPEGPKFEIDGARVFEQESTVNNEFTLWQDAAFKTTTHLELPAAATSVRWDETDQAMLYDLAYVPPAPPGNALQRNRTASVVVFSLLIVASLGIAALVYRRARGATTPAAASLVPVSVPVLPEQGASAANAQASHFCGSCGAGLPPDDKFCPHCGHRVA
jgi:hypothetical protein